MGLTKGALRSFMKDWGRNALRGHAVSSEIDRAVSNYRTFLNGFSVIWPEISLYPESFSTGIKRVSQIWESFKLPCPYLKISNEVRVRVLFASFLSWLRVLVPAWHYHDGVLTAEPPSVYLIPCVLLECDTCHDFIWLEINSKRVAIERSLNK